MYVHHQLSGSRSDRFVGPQTALETRPVPHSMGMFTFQVFHGSWLTTEALCFISPLISRSNEHRKCQDRWTAEESTQHVNRPIQCLLVTFLRLLLSLRAADEHSPQAVETLNLHPHHHVCLLYPHFDQANYFQGRLGLCHDRYGICRELVRPDGRSLVLGNGGSRPLSRHQLLPLLLVQAR